MEISWSQTTSLACQQCGVVFEAEIWLIVDVVERPNLLDQIRKGTLHDLTCSKCNQTVGQVDTPLLLYCSDRTPTLLFSPAQQATADQYIEQARFLLGTLHQHLDSKWDDAWLEQGLRIISRSLLPTIFSLDAEALVHMTHEQVSTEIEAKDSQGFDAYSNIPSEFRNDLRDAFEAENDYQRNGDLATLAASIAALESLLNKPNLVQHSLYAPILNYAGSAYLRRYGIVRQMEDLERLIQILSNGTKQIPRASPVLSSIYNQLGSALQMRYNRQGQLEDLEWAIVNYRKAVDNFTDESFGDLSLYQINLGKGLFARYTHAMRNELLTSSEQR